MSLGRRTLQLTLYIDLCHLLRKSEANALLLAKSIEEDLPCEHTN